MLLRFDGQGQHTIRGFRQHQVAGGRRLDPRAETRLALPDCCVLDLAMVSGGDLATFDTRQAGAARRRGVTLAAA